MDILETKIRMSQNGIKTNKSIGNNDILKQLGRDFLLTNKYKENKIPTLNKENDFSGPINPKEKMKGKLYEIFADRQGKSIDGKFKEKMSSMYFSLLNNQNTPTLKKTNPKGSPSLNMSSAATTLSSRNSSTLSNNEGFSSINNRSSKLNNYLEANRGNSCLKVLKDFVKEFSIDKSKNNNDKPSNKLLESNKGLAQFYKKNFSDEKLSASSSGCLRSSNYQRAQNDKKGNLKNLLSIMDKPKDSFTSSNKLRDFSYRKDSGNVCCQTESNIGIQRINSTNFRSRKKENNWIRNEIQRNLENNPDNFYDLTNLKNLKYQNEKAKNNPLRAKLNLSSLGNN